MRSPSALAQQWFAWRHTLRLIEKKPRLVECFMSRIDSLRFRGNIGT